MGSSRTINQLVLASVAGSQASQLTAQLTRDRFNVTEINSQGGFLRETTVSLLIGLDKARLPTLLQHIRECCPTRRRFLPAHADAPFLETQPVMIETEVGGATVYAFDVERFEQL